MSLLTLCQWLQSTDLGTSVRESSYAYPVILSSHLTGIALFGGMLVVSDLRLLGFALTGLPIAEVTGRFRLWKRIGLIWMITFGFLLFSAKADKYYLNPYFWTKVSLLLLTAVHAVAFRGSVYSRTAEMDAAGFVPARARLAAWLSLGLWAGILIAGRMIGYYELPNEP
jgi:hypothetical protein